MRILNLRQGSPEWNEHRRTKFNASDAPAMLGESPHCSRSELLRRMATGIAPEVDAGTQRRFDAGHKVEALLHAHAEKIIGEPLHPFVGVADFDARYSASFDGCTFVGDEVDECKLLNARLRAAFADMETIAPEHRERSAAKCLPIDYRIQMEQQARIAKADRVLFLTGELRDGETLGDVFSCWYYPDDALWARIQAGWEQFAEDLKNFVAGEAVQPAPVGRAPEALPALRIEVTGMVTASNLDAFKTHALAVFGGINTSLRSDNDFADAERTVKWCGDVEERLAAAKQHALSQTESIDALFRAIDEISAEARRVRLDLDKKVKAKKEERRGEIVATGVAALREHTAALNVRIGKPYMPVVPADFGGAVKGLKSLDSMEDKVSTELARAKIAANEIADRIQTNLRTIDELAADFPLVIPDRDQLVLKAPDDCRAVVSSRIAEHQAREHKRIEAERERIRAEEAARADREALERAAAERRQQEEAARAAAPPPTPAPTAAPTPAPAPVANVVPMQRPTAAPASAPTLRLGQINERIAPLSIDAAGLAALGFQHSATDKAAKLYFEHQFHGICAAIAQHAVAAANRLQAA